MSTYRMWHRHEPDREFPTDIDFGGGPGRSVDVPQIGTVMEISYDSSKWKRRCAECGRISESTIHCGRRTEPAPDVYETYVHYCTSRAPVYAPTSRRDSDAVLHLEWPRGRVRFTQLAFMSELVLRLNDGRKVVQGFTFPNTPLYCLDDRRTLIIPWSKRPFIVTGSRMRITQHGIIR